MDAVLVLAMALEQAGLVLVATRGSSPMGSDHPCGAVHMRRPPKACSGRQNSAVGAFGVI